MNRQLRTTARVALSLMLLLTLTISAPAFPRTLRVAVNCTLPPYQFVSQEGNCVGLHIDILNAIARDKGFFLEYLPMETGQDCMHALSNGDADVVLGIIPSTVDNRFYTFSDSISTATLSLLAHKSSPAATAGAQKALPYAAVFSVDTARISLLSNLGFARYLVVGNQMQVFARQQDEDAAAFIGLRESLVYQMKETGTLDDYVTLREYLDTVSFSIAIKTGDRELLRTLNDGIARFRSDIRYASAYKKWIVQESEEQWRVVFRRIVLGGALAGCLVVAYSAFSSHLRRILQRQVAEQTREIQASKHRMELQLAQIQTENDLRNRIIKYSPSAMLLFDSDGRIALINKRARAVAGISSEAQVENAQTLPVFKEILRREMPEIFSGIHLPENQSIRLEVNCVSHSFRYTMHRVVQLGRSDMILLSVQDVTAEEQHRQEAFEEEKSRTLNRVVAGIAHEIRNPLTAISTFATLIGSNGEDREVQTSFALYVPREVDRINRLIEGLIHYARPPKPRPEDIEVCALLEDSLALVRALVKKSHVGLRCDCTPDLHIVADRDQLKQILVNLLMNGLEAVEKRRQRRTEEGTLSIYLSAQCRDALVVITLRDEGIGMSPEEIKRCTDPFFSTKDRGTGLGLALCQQYIADNGGTMSIASEEMVYTEITLQFRRAEP